MDAFVNVFNKNVNIKRICAEFVESICFCLKLTQPELRSITVSLLLRFSFVFFFSLDKNYNKFVQSSSHIEIGAKVSHVTHTENNTY